MGDPYNSLNKWWGIGKEQVSPCSLGVDRHWVNEEEIHSFSENWGDRYDAWIPGYNEIFSHHSSPSTKKWNNTNSDILVWFYEENHGEAGLKIYKVGENGFNSYDDILEVTPPSRPMGIKTEECVYSNGHFRPKISWVHNMETDMTRGGGLTPEYKRYKIYRSIADDMTETPPDAYRYPENVYSYIATVDIPSGSTPTFTDNSTISGCALPDGPCPPNCWIQYPIRYRVQAVDEYNDASVLSDFAFTTGLRLESSGPGGGEEQDKPMAPGNDIPTVFDLKQNYPNPFNPSTNIQFDLPKDVYVSIKVYDMAGREMAVLINDFRNAGRYIVAFNGSQLASGIYFYTIKAGDFEVTKRMVLVK